MSRKRQRVSLMILFVIFASALMLSSALPVRLDSTVFWLIISIVFLGTLRPLVTRLVIEKLTNRHVRPASAFLRLVLTELLLLIAGAVPVFLLYAMFVVQQGGPLTATTLFVPIGLTLAFAIAHIAQ